MGETLEPVSFVLFDTDEKKYFNGSDWDEDRLEAMHFVDRASAFVAESTVYPERHIQTIAEGVELSDPIHLAAVLSEVTRIRDAQDRQWGGVAHDDHNEPWDWVAYIIKSLGRSIVYPPTTKVALGSFRQELVKVAALAVAAIQSIDRHIEREALSTRLRSVK
jgi:hypothetical protein